MKRSLILVLLSVGTLTMSAITSNIPEVEAVAQFDRSTMISKKLRSAQESMDKGDYQSAINTLNSLLKLSPSHSKAKEMLDQCKQGIKQQKAREEQAFKDACKSGSTDALNSFIRRYPNSEYVKSARQRLDDYSIWEIAKKRNTIDSYNLYLQKSSVLAYKEDAQAAIKKIKADQAWSVCMNTENESLLNDYISTYPESPNIGEARYRLNLLKGERMYRDGFTDMAYSYLGDANLHRTLTGEAAAHYAELKDKKTFNEMLASSDIDKVRKYLNTLSFSSPYYNDTSNHLALLLGAKLSAWSSEYNMNEALSFAKDESTRSTVKKYINQAKDQHKTKVRQLKAQNRKMWWKNNFLCGVQMKLDGNFNENLVGLDLGFLLRLGHTEDVFNFIVGADYRYFVCHADSYSTNSNLGKYNQPSGSELVLPIGVRINITEIDDDLRLYIALNYNYGLCLSDEKNILKNNNSSIEPQLGIASEHWDFSLYYKGYLSNPFEVPNAKSDYLGLTVAYYF